MVNLIIEGTLPAGTRIRIGVPAECPERAINALVELFSEKTNIIRASLGLMEILHVDGSSEFTYTVGIKCAANEGKTIDEVIKVLQNVPIGRWGISIVPFTNEYLPPDAIVFFDKQKKASGWLSRLFAGD